MTEKQSSVKSTSEITREEKQLYHKEIYFCIDQNKFKFRFLLTSDWLQITLYHLTNEKIYQNKISNDNLTPKILEMQLIKIKTNPKQFFEFDPKKQQFIYISGFAEILLKAIHPKNDEVFILKVEKLKNDLKKLESQIKILVNKNCERRIKFLENKKLDRRIKILENNLKSIVALDNKKKSNRLIKWDTSKKYRNVMFIDKDRTAISTAGNFWRGIQGNRILTKGTTIYKIRINTLFGNGHDGIMIGVVESSHSGINYQSPKGYMLYSLNGHFYGSNSQKEKFCDAFDEQDILTVVVDMDKKHLSFRKNEKTLGVASTNLPQQVRLAMDLHFDRNSASILII
ncbi:spry domain containing socs box protein [Anaeramoeba flamelloides]|uniref:Spry domain containing socs box protein n=1 Tax=Anaeramoeba flamelloides TaxID=1746091 RepID=A0AAV7Z9X4_9EUKA|nr:spry domain containing socs box protein [Anaeramoeba flamelloides]